MLVHKSDQRVVPSVSVSVSEYTANLSSVIAIKLEPSCLANSVDDIIHLISEIISAVVV